MIERLPDIANVFAQNRVSADIRDQINQMAHDTDIVDMVFYNLSGVRIPTADALWDPVEVMDHSTRHMDMAGGHEGHGMPISPIPEAPDRLGNSLLTASPTMEENAGSIAAQAGSPMVTAIIPIYDRSDNQLGYVRYVVVVNDVMAAYSSGLTQFAVVLVIFGIAIFGVPAIGYVIQKRIADRSNSDAKYLASFDALTGLLNRRGFVARANRKVEGKAIKNLAYLDADAFKSVNDTYGHAVGDAYLQNIAEAIKTLFGDTSLCSRLGGDEFVIADTTLGDDEMVDRLDKLRAICAEEIDLNGVTVRSSVSIGVTRFDGDPTLEDLLSKADMALYFAKAQGGNSVSVYDLAMSTEMEHLRALEARLREAVTKCDFALHYQPLIHSRTRQVFGYEALLRLNDRDGNSISPEAFIPLAEKMGLIEEIGTWVLYAATRQIADMNARDVIAINLSPEQFKSGKLVGIVKDALSQADLAPSRLELEITESLLLDDSAEVAFQITALKDMGVSIAMDDFGTGFSSLSYLWKFGFDRIKIDRSFIRALEEDPERSLGLVESIVLLGKKLDMEITAEGVETQTHSAILSSLGCDVLQGFYFGRPEPLSLPAPVPDQGSGLPRTG